MKQHLIFSGLFLMVLVCVTGCINRPDLAMNHRLANRNGAGVVDSFDANGFQEVPAQIGDSQPIPPAQWEGENASLGQNGPNELVNGKEWPDKVYFAYNRYSLTEQGRAVADALGAYLLANPKEAVVIEGHTDERGSEEYNRALGEHRAQIVSEYLQTIGVTADRIITVSYGEDRPAVPGAVDEDGYKLNRRAQFFTGLKK